MTRVIDLISDARFTFGGFGVAAAVVLVLALALLMPPGKRRQVRFPAVLLLLHVVVVFVRWLVPLSDDVRRGLEVTALFLLLACLGRGAFLLGVDWFFAYRLRRPLPRIFRDIVQVLVYFGVAVVTLRAMGAELGSLLTTSALLTAVIGLSLQETLGNLFAGLAIQAQQPFRVGDWIQIDGTPDASIGKVVEINWRATKILTNDWVEILIPNGMLAKSPIKNYTQPTPVSRRIVKVQGPYDKPPHVVEAALLAATRDCPGVLADPAPVTWVSQYADSGVEYAVVFFIDDFSARPVIDSRVRRRIWYALQRVGVSIPFPVRDVRVHQESEATQRDAGAERAHAIERMLRTVDFLDILPGDALGRLAEIAETRLYAAGENIIRQGDPGSELFIIREGSALVLVAQGERDPIEVARLEAGSVVGEMSLMTGEPRSATVRAATACSCVVLGHDAFREVLAAHPELVERISDVLASRQAEIDSAQAAEDAYDRVTRTNLLLDRIKGFFSLWPGADGSGRRS